MDVLTTTPLLSEQYPHSSHSADTPLTPSSQAKPTTNQQPTIFLAHDTKDKWTIYLVYTAHSLDTIVVSRETRKVNDLLNQLTCRTVQEAEPRTQTHLACYRDTQLHTDTRIYTYTHIHLSLHLP